MKKILFFFLLVTAWTARAQSFEGIIKWSMKTEITDPAEKAKMDDAQAKMNSPENQAKMKQLQEKMNDPQFKAMMSSNPQMKAQMEAMMKNMGGGAASMAPTSMSMEIKGDNALIKIEGGAFAIEMLSLKDKDIAYSIDRANKTYSALPQGNRGASAQQSAAVPKVTKTTETTKILGYTCTKYIVEVTEYGRTMTQNIWATTDIKNLDFKKFAKMKAGRGQSFYYEGMDGMPLRVETNDPSAKMTMEVTEIKPESLPATDFVIPADFRETPGVFGR